MLRCLATWCTRMQHAVLASLVAGHSAHMKGAGFAAQAVSQLAPRGVYVCGNTATTTGLTVRTAHCSAESIAAASALLLLLRMCTPPLGRDHRTGAGAAGLRHRMGSGGWWEARVRVGVVRA